MTDSHASTTPGPAFGSLSLPPAVIENLQRLGYERMTPIQAVERIKTDVTTFYPLGVLKSC